MNFQDNLSELQKQRLQKAIDGGTDFSLKLANHALDGPEFSFLNKVQARRLEKNKIAGKGMILRLSSNQVKAIKGKSYPPKDVPAIPNAKTKKLVKGSAIPPSAIVGVSAGVLSILNTIGVLEPVKSLVMSLGKEIEYMILNPNARRWKNIYAERLPRLAKNWRDLGNDIVFLMRKPKQTVMITNRINRIQRRRADIVSLAQMLLEQLPKYKALAEAKDEELQRKEEAKVNKKINDLEAQLSTLKGGNGLQIGPRGNGLQIGPPSSGAGKKKKLD